MYYPKSQITTNLYSNGELVILGTGETYTGYYWATSGGKYFTGKTPSTLRAPLELGKTTNDGFFAPSNEPAAPGSTSYISPSVSTFKYAKLKGDDINRNSRVPAYSPPKPLDEDYIAGSLVRFLCKNVSNSLFIEIDSEEYINLVNKDKNLLYKLYKPFKLNWVITGNFENVVNENRITVEYLENTKGLAGLGHYLKYNYAELYALYTKGGEYLLPNGQAYTGVYHIHPGKGAMVGRTHSSIKHDILTPISGSSTSQFNSFLLQPNIYNRPNNGGSSY